MVVVEISLTIRFPPGTTMAFGADTFFNRKKETTATKGYFHGQWSIFHIKISVGLRPLALQYNFAWEARGHVGSNFLLYFPAFGTEWEIGEATKENSHVGLPYFSFHKLIPEGSDFY